MTEQEWLENFARSLGTTAATAEERELVLSLASVAAHASERSAAPVACWLAARAGYPLAEALDIARRVGPIST